MRIWTSPGERSVSEGQQDFRVAWPTHVHLGVEVGRAAHLVAVHPPAREHRLRHQEYKQGGRGGEFASIDVSGGTPLRSRKRSPEPTGRRVGAVQEIAEDKFLMWYLGEGCCQLRRRERCAGMDMPCPNSRRSRATCQGSCPADIVRPARVSPARSS